MIPRSSRAAVCARLCGFALVSALLWPVPVAADVLHVYDALNRLRATVDQASNQAAIWEYDPVGNILRILRQPASQVTILEFSPQGVVGICDVRVLGIAFSTTPSQNTVTIGGVQATVSSATTTELVVCPGVGTTTGTITVTTPGGSHTTTETITVQATAPLPTITGFNPTVADPGTTVTVTGTNFDPTPDLTSVRAGANNRFATVTSVTATTVAFLAPTGAMPGRLTVTTPQGSVTSVTDLFVPPPPDTAATVAFTRRWTMGETFTLPAMPSSSVALLTLDALAGRRLSVLITPITAGPDVSIFAPTGTLLLGFSGANNLFEIGSDVPPAIPAPTPMAGTYTIRVRSFNPTTPYTVTIHDDATDIVTPITPGGAAVPVTFTLAGQNARLTFAGTAGQRVAFFLQGAPLPTTTLRHPDGTVLATLVSGSDFLEAQTLPVTGTYTLFLDHYSVNTNSVTVTAYDVPPDDSGPITPGGPSTTVTTTVPGQQGRRTFTGALNQRVSLLATNVTYFAGTILLLKPDGSTLASVPIPSGAGPKTVFMDTQTLPTAGQYTILVDPLSNYTGSATLTLYDVVDVTGTIGIGLPGTTAETTVPGQAVRLTFGGTANRKASAVVTAPFGNTVSLVDPSGSTVFTSGISGFLDGTTLPVTGTYTLVIDPWDTATGQLTAVRYDFVDVTASANINGSAVPVNLPNPGQNGTVTFSNNQVNRLVTVHITSNTITDVTVTLKQPNGTVMTTVFSAASSFDLPQQTLPVTGTYSIIVDPYIARTGSLNVQVSSP